MTDKKCDGNCCDHFFDGYEDVEDDYDIDRLKDIIKICEFLIQTKQHRKQKREVFSKIFEDDKEEKEEVKRSPYRIYRYRWPPQDYWGSIPYWERTWFN